MSETQRLRRADVESLMAAIDDDLDRASAAFSEVMHAADSVHEKSSAEAGLAMLRAVSTAARHMQDATQTLALALSERGEQTTRIAQAAGVNRVTVNRWKRAGEPAPKQGDPLDGLDA